MKALIDVTEDLEIVRDILDQQVVDRDGEEMGRVDGLRLEIREGKAPRIHSIEMGGVALARRVHPGLETWVDGWRRRFGIRKVEDLLGPLVGGARGQRALREARRRGARHPGARLGALAEEARDRPHPGGGQGER